MFSKTENIQISIIIVNYNVYNDVAINIDSIAKNLSKIDYEIIVVDNKSTDRSIDNITKTFPFVKYVPLEANHGFGYANNVGMREASGKYFLLVNPDIIFNDNSIEKLYNYLESNVKTGAAGPIQVKPNEGVEYYYSFFPSVYSRFTQEFGLYEKAPQMKARTYDFWDNNIKFGKPFKVNWVMASCIMLRREIFEKLGGFDEAFFLYEEEVDWQLRMKKAGWDSMIVSNSEVLHNHHSSASKLGNMFIKYHEFRSRIIFSAKNNKFPKNIIEESLRLNAFFFRICYITVFNFKSFRIYSNRIYLYFDLIKLIFSSKQKTLSSRFSFAEYSRYFLENKNALL